MKLSDVLRATGVPDFVKTASVSDDADPGADYSTRESTFLTYARALWKGASAEQVSEAFDHAKFWDILPHCESFRTKLAQLRQPWNLADDAFCMLQKTASGDKLRKYAAFDPSSTRMAAIGFYDNRANYPFAWRHETARNILSKAAAYNIPLPDYVDTYLHKAACFGAASPESLQEALLIREQVCPNEHAEDFQKVAVVLEQMIETPALRANMDFLKEAMATVDAFDQEANPTVPLIEEVIGDSLTLPNLQKTAAEDKLTISLINGHELDVRTLTKEALAAVDPNLAAMDHNELANVLPTLPKPDAELLTRLVA